ncbi:hypothetical protein [Burkholderia ubonensis]|uniref:Uncharacterized protein n=1 Tax=Burkholderia ubonensis TaxID=101571 RepID=A0AAW3MMY8_9BURK|nr:hypothetical protein [Burkholderia ubonensis]KVK99011.1 hypothetical protein WJ45_16205 [Burkholderia ubonensis]KVN74678.1 hypothetical protein WJ67_18215 [Burkholderia ubonensis]KVO39579.1 hypothetical protein WJ75_08755 [Burkholderia ubonensis]KVP89322.1 hypothetical protein WJ96_20170 [Burkholderia ubonensis]KVQ54207.1 hypothetical protein WK04_02950 [Burkholderia ubonensis]
MKMTIADFRGFDRLPSRHECSTQALERAIASNCATVRTRHHEYREIVAFRRQPHSRKLASTLRIAALRLRGGGSGDEAVASLGDSRHLAAIAGMLAEWLCAYATPIGWVDGIEFPENTESISGTSAAHCLLRIVEFGRRVVDARAPDDLDLAACHLVEAARHIGTNRLVAVLLGRASIRVRHPARSGAEYASLVATSEPRPL